ncbi:Probable ATP-dependent DNA helicase YoaA [Pseudoalteromonas sp. 3J6]|uniref:ATP-dependent DNA helicase n=1 Tax=unclassified Pseudoalteromonas TaxID=194690 RepID=UPI00110A0C8F|nr:MULTISPECIES: ATP-dependent DNA helicase [unclassified Pseudoalteromonas]MDN3487285.1 ATP-dependent DNA helicase [Pseudoalteromonas sp. APC 3224]TMP71201.1 ATP-dependent helicase [Pseudoalteromonas sp. S1609]CAD2223584.1 Probable ATP-dependent DNA helicase YoaA [Pseudoalteromonas sp. 3J6]
MIGIIKQLFSATGPLALSIDGYTPRQPQIDMAVAVDDALKTRAQLVVEAGTGTGKTFAYLAPALKSKGKTIISTGSKALQEQLYHRDLPVLVKALGAAKKTALLKGRANYLCTYRLTQHVAHVPTDDPDVMHQLAMVAKFASETHSGDLADCIGIEEDAKVLPYVSSTADNCLGKECPDFQECYIRKARLKAADADVVVINHHLFFADMAVKESGFAELMPNADAYIFDEAHQLSEIASDYFGETMSTKKLVDLINDLRAIYRAEIPDMLQLGKSLNKLETSVADLRLQFGVDGSRGDWREKLSNKLICSALHRVISDLEFVYQVLKLCLERSDKIEHPFERVLAFKGQLERVFDTAQTGFSYWYETTRRYLTINITPLNVSAKFALMMKESGAGFVFTSATLSVDNELSHFNASLGLKPKQSMMVDSPFDYANQALLCLPRYLPQSHEDNMPHAIVKLTLELIKSAKGRCFVLFTSYRMMHLVAEGLTTQMDYPVYMQGQMSKRIILEKFTRHGNAVLLGTASFWEGVDVRGSTLSCVIIDKLPFAAPDDPLLQAKMQDCQMQGKDPFAHIQLPQAVIALKQGVGRLIRDNKDKGVLVICDNRLVTRQYGQVFLKSLPPMRRTRSLEDANTFLKHIN